MDRGELWSKATQGLRPGEALYSLAMRMLRAASTGMLQQELEVMTSATS